MSGPGTSDAVTRGVRVRVHSEYSSEHSAPHQSRWFFLYTIVIANEGDETVQLVSRHWVITDATGHVEEVKGPGVVGQQPVLEPGEHFEYTSGCPPGAPRFEHALFVKCQVMSRGPTHAVVDAGHKSHAIESGLPRVWRSDDLVFASCSDEHCVLRAAAVPGAVLPALGDGIWLIPGHCDPTINLHDAMLGVRGGLDTGVVERVIRVDARGCVA